MASCTDDDANDSNGDDDGMQVNPLSGDFFPSKADNEWNYDVTSKDNTTDETINATDRLFVDTPNETSFELDVNDNSISNGTMNSVLTNGILNKTDTTLSANGQLVFSIDGLEDINIPYNNAVLLNTQAPDGSELSTFMGTINQTVQSFPVTINYTLKTNHIKNWTSIDLNGQSYDEVTQANFVLTMVIDIALPLVGNRPIIDEQETLVINNYYGKNIGLIKSEADTTITLNSETLMLLQSLPDIDVSQIPENISTQNTQNLTSFTVN